MITVKTNMRPCCLDNTMGNIASKRIIMITCVCASPPSILCTYISENLRYRNSNYTPLRNYQSILEVVQIHFTYIQYLYTTNLIIVWITPVGVILGVYSLVVPKSFYNRLIMFVNVTIFKSSYYLILQSH
jgi:hypothetical protein